MIKRNQTGAFQRVSTTGKGSTEKKQPPQQKKQAQLAEPPAPEPPRQPQGPAKRNEPARSEGRIPPQATDVERAVLGAMLIDKDATFLVTEILTEESLYSPKHQKYFRAMLSLMAKEQPVDCVTLLEELRATKNLDSFEDPIYVTDMTREVTSAANVEYHARIVAEKALLRNMIVVGSSIVSDAFRDAEDALELLDEAENALSRIRQGISITREPSDMSECMHEAMEQINRMHRDGTGMVGKSYGFRALDEATSGMEVGKTILIAGESSHGKSAISTAIARNASKNGHACCIFAMEAPQLSASNRLLAQEANVPLTNIRTGKLNQVEMKRIVQATSRIAAMPLYIDDTPIQTYNSLRAKTRSMQRKKGCTIFVFDYLGLIQLPPSRDTRAQDLGDLSRNLKLLTSELGITSILIHALKRPDMGRNRIPTRPTKAMLRDSGAIEYNMDTIMLVNNWAQVCEVVPPGNGSNSGLQAAGFVEVIIDKGRDSGESILNLGFNKYTQRFRDFGEPEEPQGDLPF